MDSMTKVRLAGLLVLSGLTTTRIHAANPIYRCVTNGQTTLTDKPCDGAATTRATDLSTTSSTPALSSGAWLGQAQFGAKESGRGDLEEVHSIARVTLTLTADGKVESDSLENGCKLLGLWSPGLTPRNVSLDLSLSGCRYPGLNRRYSGSMVVEPSGTAATIRLEAYTAVIPGQPIRHYDVGATLHR